MSVAARTSAVIEIFAPDGAFAGEGARGPRGGGSLFRSRSRVCTARSSLCSSGSSSTAPGWSLCTPVSTSTALAGVCADPARLLRPGLGWAQLSVRVCADPSRFLRPGLGTAPGSSLCTPVSTSTAQSGVCAHSARLRRPSLGWVRLPSGVCTHPSRLLRPGLDFYGPIWTSTDRSGVKDYPQITQITQIQDHR